MPAFFITESVFSRRGLSGTRWTLSVAAFWLFTGPCLADADELPPEQRPPNVILFLVDDWGWTDAGCQGSDLYQTPRIDALAERGMRFTQAYSACTVCSPTRAAILTGLYPARLRVTDYIPGLFASRSKQWRSTKPLRPPEWTQRLEHRYTTIPEVLGRWGYRSIHVGKWHLTPRTDDLETVRGYYPDRHGFDVNLGGNQWGQPGSYYHPFESRRVKDSDLRGERRRIAAHTMNLPDGSQPGDYLTDFLTSKLIEELSRNPESPFFVYFPFYAVHTPIEPHPKFVDDFRRRVQPDANHRNANYASMVAAVDSNVGRVIDYLDRREIFDDTLIILTGDNGGLVLRNGPTFNAPLRSGKGDVYEGGVRVPAIVSKPGLISAGSVSDEPIISMDYFATILDLVEPSGGTSRRREPATGVDGVSLVPLFSDPAAELSRDALYWHYPHFHPGGARPYSAIRSGDFRLVSFQGEAPPELYDLAADLGETTDLADKLPAKTREMLDRLRAWKAEVGAQDAVPNPDYMPDHAADGAILDSR